MFGDQPVCDYHSHEYSILILGPDWFGNTSMNLWFSISILDDIIGGWWWYLWNPFLEKKFFPSQYVSVVEPKRISSLSYTLVNHENDFF